MGCASSGPLPFLTNRGNQAVAESPRLNGEPPYELKMVNNKLRENGMANVKDVNEAYELEKTKEGVDSTAVQSIIGGAIQTKDDIVNQVKALGDVVSEKLTSAADSIEETMGSAFENLTGTVDSFEDKLNVEMTSTEENVKSILEQGAETTVSEVKAEDIDELLDSLPTEEEVTEAAETSYREVTEKAADEVRGGNGE